MEGRKVLVTGGAGFLGSHLVERLSARNDVEVLDDLSTGSIRNLQDAREEVHVHKASVLQPKALAEALAGMAVVYHLAAKTSPAEGRGGRGAGGRPWPGRLAGPWRQGRPRR